MIILLLFIIIILLLLLDYYFVLSPVRPLTLMGSSYANL